MHTITTTRVFYPTERAHRINIPVGHTAIVVTDPFSTGTLTGVNTTVARADTYNSDRLKTPLRRLKGRVLQLPPHRQ